VSELNELNEKRVEGIAAVDMAMATIERVVQLRADAETKLRDALRATADPDRPEVAAAEQDVARSLRMASIAHHNVRFILRLHLHLTVPFRQQ
jgi:hypothetical protein